ncbi:hypothetical protein HanIR_Chr01g0036911 [Helianthus annuus]|nr:hypothetical protein HanIR_Chr01g0036911 [Helianthus annuus]
MGITSLTPTELDGGLGKEAGQTNQEWRKSIVRMQGVTYNTGGRLSSTKNRTRKSYKLPHIITFSF